MTGVGTLEQLTKTYGLPIGLLIAVCFVLGLVVVRLYRDNNMLHAKLTELLDQRGKFLDSILTEAIHGKTNRRSS